MDHTEQFVAILVTALALGVLAGTISSYIAVEFFHRHTKWRLARQEADIIWRTELLVEQSANQLNRDHDLGIREQAVILREKNMTHTESQFARRTAQAVTALHATKQALDDDTTIMDLDQQWLPELRDQLNDTVLLPRIEEEL